ncbi:hypothetical protein EHS13_25180 [Paenibacillus psychroresistens]|uniref:Uncharacterized protein n=1 Tax=Paenibacillus psychroresistens TaxID=1778678 RepID=A0A6B8RQ27_9BACL|nr:hypothetical protein [Paenibacillus psychroresistens]QGQ97947.1 hypothetical protein EHS13_25180 [Paenibacillus psychroresistens]
MNIFAKINQQLKKHVGNGTDSLDVFFQEERMLLPVPEKQQVDEITHNIARLKLTERLQIIQVVKNYMDEFTIPHIRLEPSWTSGHAMVNELFVARGDQSLMRCNVEAFFQNRFTGLRELVYLVSLVKFEGDRWSVFQVKEVNK